MLLNSTIHNVVNRRIAIAARGWLIMWIVRLTSIFTMCNSDYLLQIIYKFYPSTESSILNEYYTFNGLQLVSHKSLEITKLRCSARGISKLQADPNWHLHIVKSHVKSTTQLVTCGSNVAESLGVTRKSRIASPKHSLGACERTDFNNRLQRPEVWSFVWFKTWQDWYILATSYNLASIPTSQWLLFNNN